MAPQFESSAAQFITTSDSTLHHPASRLCFCAAIRLFALLEGAGDGVAALLEERKRAGVLDERDGELAVRVGHITPSCWWAA